METRIKAIHMKVTVEEWLIILQALCNEVEALNWKAGPNYIKLIELTNKMKLVRDAPIRGQG